MGHWCVRTGPAQRMGHGVPGVSAQCRVGQDKGHEHVPAHTHQVVLAVERPFRVKSAICLHVQVAIHNTHKQRHTLYVMSSHPSN